MNLPMRFRAAWGTLWGSTPTALDASARGGSRTVAWNPAPSNFGSLRQSPTVLWRARDSYRNSAFARRAVEATTAAAVGTGIRPLLETSNLALKQRAQVAFLRWTDQCDTEGLRDFFGFQADVLRNMLIDGESLILLSPSGRGAVPLSMQLLSSEYLDTSRDTPGKITGGIEYSPTGERVAYWIYLRHPADIPDFESVRIPAPQVIHVFSPPAPGVPRGVSWLQPALLPLHELQSFLETELVRARTASLFAGFVRTQDASNPLASRSEVALEPGSMTRLGPGEEVQFAQPPEMSSFEQYTRVQLRAIAAALSMPYEALSGDNSQITFASGRHSLIAWKRWLECLQHHVMVYQFCRPIWDMWLRFALFAGVLDGSPEDYYARWVAPPLPMLDARAEVLASTAAVRSGFVSRTEAVAQSGMDVEELDAEIARENARCDAFGLVFDSDPRRTTAQGMEQVSSQEDTANAAA